MTTNNNRYLKIILPTAFCALVVVIMLIVLSSCNAEKRAVKKSDKHFFKAVAWDKPNVHNRCSDIAPPIVMTKDSFIYKPGKNIPSSKPEYVYVDCDSVVKALSSNLSPVKPVRVKCPPCDSVRVDTAYVSVRNTEVDRNKEKAQEATIKEQDKKIASQSTTIKYQWWVIIALAIPWLWKLVRVIFKF